MNNFELNYKPFGERSVLMEWPQKIDEDILKDVLSFKNKLKKNTIKEIVDVTHTYNSILVIYELTINNFYDAFLELKALYLANSNEKIIKNKLWKIPVCYDAVFSIDLNAFSTTKKLSKEHIITLHSSTIYTVYFIGFLPGFLYLGGLKNELHLPRKSTPNLHVKKGSVAIGGEQTGIYPQDAPGGWHIIGNSPINFFDVQKQIPCFASAGNKIQFVSVDLDTYNEIKIQVDLGVYKIESEVIDG